MKKINIALLGLGTVGTGVARIIADHSKKIQQVSDYDITISKALVKSIAERKDDFTRQSGIQLVESLDEILVDDSITIVCELMGGTTFARTAIEQALNNGKHVVTANKDLLAIAGPELEQLAKDNGVSLYYEAAVAGGIPILKPIMTTLASDEITKILGIVNGTTNFILTKMTQNGSDFGTVLKEAQELGFAEADPSGDVDGYDAARKMVILTRLGLGMTIDLDEVKVHGIRNVQKEDIEMARRLGYVIKLLGITEILNGKLHTEVGPMLVPATHPLATINNEKNAVYTISKATGEMMFYGAGAGELPTANSVVSDVLEVLKDIDRNTLGQSSYPFQRSKEWANMDDILTKGYINVILNDKPGAFMDLTKIFTDLGISFDKINQEPIGTDKEKAQVIIITHTMTYSQKSKMITALKANPEIEFVSYYDVMK